MKKCLVCKSDINEKETGIYKCLCGYMEITTDNSKSKEIDVPLTWEEIDSIVLSLRLTNKVLKSDMGDKLEEKMSNYSMKAKMS